MEEKIDKEAIKKQKLKEELKKIQEVYPQVKKLEKFSRTSSQDFPSNVNGEEYIYKPNGEKFIREEYKYFVDEFYKRYEIYYTFEQGDPTMDFISLIYDKIDNEFVPIFDKAKESVDKIEKGSFCWIKWMSFHVDSSKGMSATFRCERDVEFPGEKDIVGSWENENKIVVTYDEDYPHVSNKISLTGFMRLANDRYYIPGQPVLKVPNGYKIVREDAATHKGFFVLHNEVLDCYVYVHDGKMSKEYKNYGLLLESLDCAERSEDGRFIVVPPLYYGDGGYEFYFDDPNCSKSFVNLVDYSETDDFAIVKRNKYQKEEIRYREQRSIVETTFHIHFREDEKCIPMELPNFLKIRGELSLEDVLRVKPEIFESIPTNRFADKERIKKYVSAIIEGMKAKMPKSASETHRERYERKLEEYKENCEKIKKMIKDKIEKERKKLAEAISSQKEEERVLRKIDEGKEKSKKTQEKMKKDIMEGIDSTQKIIDEIYDSTDDIVDGGINQ